MRSPGLNAEEGVNSMACPLLNSCTDPETTTPLSVTLRAPVIVEAFMAALVKSVTAVFGGTLVAPLPGRMDATAGAVPEGAVVKVNWLLVIARELPDRS